MTHYLLVGMVLGLSAGFAPGPLLALVISETLRHGIGAGVRVALSPLVTDAPIIILTVFALSRLADSSGVLGAVSLIGGAFILYMGMESFRPSTVKVGESDAGSKSLLKGVLANALSPHPYLFWLSVGGSIMAGALEVGTSALVAFLCSFYVCLVGAKVLTAVLVGRSRSFLLGRAYYWITRLLGIALCFMALMLFRDGLRLFGIAPM